MAGAVRARERRPSSLRLAGATTASRAAPTALEAFGLGSARDAARGRALRRRAAARGDRRGGGARTRRSCSPTSRPASSTRDNERIVLDALRELRDDVRRTVVVVTHSRARRRSGRPRDRDARREGRGVSAIATAVASWRCSAVGRPRRAASARSPRSTTSTSTIAAGERVALLGPLRLGQDDAPARARRSRRADARRGELARRPLASLDAAARGRARAGIAYVFQGANLLPDLHRARERRLRRARARTGRGGTTRGAARARRALPRSSTRCRRSCPGGEAQRVAIARALAQQPDAAALRRADRPPRLRHRRARARPDRRAAGSASASRSSIATHDADVAARYERVVELADGRVAGEERWHERGDARWLGRAAARSPARTAIARRRARRRGRRCSARCCCSSATRCAR